MNQMFFLTILAIVVLTIVYVVLLHEQKTKAYKHGRTDGFKVSTKNLKHSTIQYYLAVLQDIQRKTKHQISIDYNFPSNEINVYYTINGKNGKANFAEYAPTDYSDRRFKRLINILNK